MAKSWTRKDVVWLGVAMVSLAFSEGCKKTEEKRAPAAPSQAPAAQPPARQDPGVPAAAPPSVPHMMPGALSEADFKALHQLKTGSLPPRQGKMVRVGGQEAYLSLPKSGQPPFPGVVVIHEWWGLNDNIKHWADRLAADGYAALAVDLYGGKVATTADAAMQIMKAVHKTESLAVLAAAHKHLADDPNVRARKRGSIGWCFGGAVSLQHALATPDLDAAVMYYGSPIRKVAKLKTLKAPLLGIFANKDRHITPKAVDEFEKALRDAGVRHQILRFDAGHAFANPSQPVYDGRAAKEAWEKARAFLAEHLKK